MTARDPLTGDPQFAAASRVEYFCLWCNQGMANWIEIYDRDGDDTVPAAIVLSDFGAGVRQSATQVSMRYAPPVHFIVTRLRYLMDHDLEPRIDRVVISHQDADHLNLLQAMVSECERRTIPLRITEIRWGGGNWGPSANATLRRLTPFADRVRPWQGTYSDYRRNMLGAFYKRALFRAGNVFFRTLVVDAPIYMAGDDIERNGSGAVIVVEFDGVGTIILPGDATVDTLVWADDRMLWWERGTGTAAVRPCFVMSVPHHGAYRTLIDEAEGTGVDGDDEFVAARAFIELTRPDSLAVSAGAMNGHHHPHLSVLNVLSRYAGAGGLSDEGEAVTHSIAYWNDLANKWEIAPAITLNVYTTIIQLDDPNWVANYQFVMNSDRTVHSHWFPFDAPTSASDTVVVLMQVDTPEPPPGTPPVTPPVVPARSGPITRVTARRTGGGT